MKVETGWARLPSWSAALFLFALVVIGAACSDDSGGGGGNGASGAELTVDEYFGEIETIFQESSAATDQLNEVLEDDLASASGFEEQAAALQVFLGGSVLVFDSAVSSMESIRAPVEVEQPHNDFTEATEKLATATSNLSESLGEAEDEADAAELLEEFEGEAAEPLFAIDEACADLQDIAEDNDIEADLRCTERVFPEGPDELGVGS